MKKVTAAIILDNDKVMISRRNKDDILAGKWEFPGGKVDEGETPEQCLIREMREEFGIDVSVGGFFLSSPYKYAHGEFDLLAYFVSWTDGELHPTVHDKVVFEDIAELHRYDFLPADIPIVCKLQEMNICY